MVPQLFWKWIAFLNNSCFLHFHWDMRCLWFELEYVIELLRMEKLTSNFSRIWDQHQSSTILRLIIIISAYLPTKQRHFLVHLDVVSIPCLLVRLWVNFSIPGNFVICFNQITYLSFMNLFDSLFSPKLRVPWNFGTKSWICAESFR